MRHLHPGRRFRRIYPPIRDLRARYGHRLAVRGWTRRVPSYLAASHVVVGKAGGATVHEVLASARPMLVNFLLPGQEEGNARLLEKLGGGRHVPEARALAARYGYTTGGFVYICGALCVIRFQETA